VGGVEEAVDADVAGPGQGVPGDADDDDQGGPDTPQRNLMRQLRRIRQGETVDRLVWRLE